jgi:hypothetical protein
MKLLNEREVAARLSCSLDALKRLRQQGLITHIPYRTPLYDVADLEREFSAFPLMKPTEAALKLGITPIALARMRDNGKIRSLKIGGIRYRIEDLEALLVYWASAEERAEQDRILTEELLREQSARFERYRLAKLEARREARLAAKLKQRLKLREMKRHASGATTVLGTPVRLKKASNDVWYIHWTAGRRSKRKSTWTCDRLEAERVLAEWTPSTKHP